MIFLLATTFINNMNYSTKELSSICKPGFIGPLCETCDTNNKTGNGNY